MFALTWEVTVFILTTDVVPLTRLVSVLQQNTQLHLITVLRAEEQKLQLHYLSLTLLGRLHYVVLLK